MKVDKDYERMLATTRIGKWSPGAKEVGILLANSPPVVWHLQKMLPEGRHGYFAKRVAQHRANPHLEIVTGRVK